jgi:hypothetical protein
MNNVKLMGVTLGLVLLGGSGLALADGGRDRGDRGRHEWNGGGRHDNKWDDRGRHEGWHRYAYPHHHYHYYPRWHGPPAYYPHQQRNGWGKRYGYDDGVTIIFKGRID